MESSFGNFELEASRQNMQKILRLFDVPAEDNAEEEKPHARPISCEWLISNLVP